MIKTFTLRSHFSIPIHSKFTKTPSTNLKPTSQIIKSLPRTNLINSKISEKIEVKPKNIGPSSTRQVIVGAVSVGFVMLVMGGGGLDNDHHGKALAFLGPEGPLMEDFWDNMRRYGLYALTVSTGVLYAVFQPLFELLKNPVSAILILTILGGGFYIVSQIVSAMVGISDFNYDYSM